MTERHNGSERIFEPLPPAQGRGFAGTWWGQAWLKALEDTALDNDQLRKGRKDARAGAVGAVSVRPGRITALVRGSDGTPYRSDVLVREFGDDEWDRLLNAVADRAGHIAALLDRDMPPHLVEDAAAVGVDLLPGIGDLEPECDCDAWDHCRHTAALCYQMGRLLDQDPFVLLLTRGRGERELLAELQTRSVARAARSSRPEAPEPEHGPVGVPAHEAYAALTALPPLPEPPAALEGPGRPPTLQGGTEPAPGVDAAALEFLVASAAAQAWRLLGEALSPSHAATAPGPEPTVWEDAVRLAAMGPDQRVSDRLAAGCDRGRADLTAAVRAWRQGGAAALAVLEEEWSPEPEVLAHARERITATWDEERVPRLRLTHNRWTAVGAGVQVRYGRDGRWWPYRKERGRWCPAGPPDRDPAAALAGLLEGADAD
ncbi:SWF or SNF family helicase [Streptomyces sp. URMC 123]|uniref:SWIM zinc finger family protein n=1 Tax=Streptomyces sp. URMC 123 TaxID=3423403 RepID=UPI003F1C8C84